MEKESFYTTQVSQVGIQESCPNCHTLAQRQHTFFIHKPTPAGQILSLEAYGEQYYGNPPNCPNCHTQFPNIPSFQT